MAAHQAPPSLGFSRQEHWSGLPLPFPMQESKKWKLSHSGVSDSLQPHWLQPRLSQKKRMERKWENIKRRFLEVKNFPVIKYTPPRCLSELFELQDVPPIILWLLVSVGSSQFCPTHCEWVLSHFSRVRLFVTPRPVAHQAPLPMGFSK